MSAVAPMSMGLDVRTEIVNKSESLQSDNDDIDWWPMFHHDLKRTGYTTSTGPETNNVLWAYQTYGIGGSPAVVDGNVYFGTFYEYFYCLDFETGEEIWKTSIPNGVWRASPAVEYDRVYFGSMFDNSSIYCLNAPNGEIIWRYQTPGDKEISASPAIYDGKVFISSPNPSPGCVYCLDAFTGEEIWIYENISSPGSVAVCNDKIFFGAKDYFIYCLTADTGMLLWKYLTCGNRKPSIQVSIHNNKLYAGGANGLYCLNLEGHIKWIHPTDTEIYTTPCIADGYVFFTYGRGYIACLDANSGNKIWSSKINDDYIYSSPAYADGKIYYGSDLGFRYEPKIYCLNASNGEIIWDFMPTVVVLSSPAVVDGKMYIGTLNELLCFGGESDNRPPVTPKDIKGPRNGTVHIEYTYNSTTYDPDGDQIYYKWEWPDYSSGWIGPYESNETVEIDIWFYDECQGDIRVIAKDTHHARSDWCTVEINIPRTKTSYNFVWLRFMDNFPILKEVFLRFVR